MSAPISRKRRRLINDDPKFRAQTRRRLLTHRGRNEAPTSHQCWPCLYREIRLNNARLLDIDKDLPKARIRFPCVMDQIDSTSCRHCHDNDYTCDDELGILVGNKFDVVKLNAFINDTVGVRARDCAVPDDEDDECAFVLPENVRQSFVFASIRLGKSFETIVSCHEKKHGFDRRQIKSLRLPRLLPGDRQWSAWSSSIEAFHREVADAFKDSSVSARVQETIISQIPVKREDEGQDRDTYADMIRLAA
ncbi:hypothetical protein LCI18_010141 [Fusarium solani-melongenae]|uniref:Uncharacterized protein n=1 Tax=Fusarium solani subsp. cucurbitae TaxID=2747967 RepID=A0ACD3ZDD6_FUSSC|nr:hypothetical protein LCI18_010141 [Fusarium solani-melongenae]